jgi:amino acid transporter
MVATLWAYEGWQYVTFSAGEARDPQRTFPLGIAIGTAAVVALYLLANAAYVHTLGAAGVAGSDRVAAAAVRPPSDQTRVRGRRAGGSRLPVRSTAGPATPRVFCDGAGQPLLPSTG